jgi:hypothetical protein
MIDNADKLPSKQKQPKPSEIPQELEICESVKKYYAD